MRGSVWMLMCFNSRRLVFVLNDLMVKRFGLFFCLFPGGRIIFPLGFNITKQGDYGIMLLWRYGISGIRWQYFVDAKYKLFPQDMIVFVIVEPVNDQGDAFAQRAGRTDFGKALDQTFGRVLENTFPVCGPVR